MKVYIPLYLLSGEGTPENQVDQAHQRKARFIAQQNEAARLAQEQREQQKIKEREQQKIKEREQQEKIQRWYEKTRPIPPWTPKNKKLGHKHKCINCGNKFYDLGKSPAVCISCGQDQTVCPCCNEQNFYADCHGKMACLGSWVGKACPFKNSSVTRNKCTTCVGLTPEKTCLTNT
jgi:hypothetical protein